MIKKVNLLLFLAIIGFAANLNAAVIDFRLPAFHSADMKSSEYFSTYDLTVEANPDGALLYHDGTDGFGVRYSYEADEIEGDEEKLHLKFDYSVRLYEMLITDLFYEPFNDGEGSFAEKGSYSFDNSVWTDFIADTSQTPSSASNGELYISFSSEPIVTDIWFKSLGLEKFNGNIYLEDHEFSVARIKINPVPEPATMLLLGTGLIAIAGFGRKKILKKKRPNIS